MSERYNKSTGKTVLIVMLVIEFLIVLTIFLLSMAFKDSESTPSIFGYSFYISDVKEMDSAVEVDSLVVTKNCTVDTSHVGCVMLCDKVPGHETSIFRLLSVEATNDTLIYTMCMDDVPEYTISVSADAVIGECKYSYKTLGKLILFVTSKIGIFVCVVIPALVLAFIELALGFAKEMKRRDLQKKREKVKEEQAKEHSTKQRKTRSTSAEEFADEDNRLKSMHKRKKGELPSLYRSASSQSTSASKKNKSKKNNKNTQVEKTVADEKLENIVKSESTADERTRVLDKPRVDERTKIVERPVVNDATEGVINGEEVINVGDESRLRVRNAAEQKAKLKENVAEQEPLASEEERQEIKSELEQVLSSSGTKPASIKSTEEKPVEAKAKNAAKSSLEELMQMIDSEHEKIKNSIK